MRSPHIIAPAIAFAVLIATVSWGWLAEDVRPPCAGSDEASMCWQGRITRIVDGDTLDVDGARIRLALVDAPELGEAGYDSATARLAELCPVGARAAVDVDDAQPDGSHGRAIATVACEANGIAVIANAEMIDGGHAGIYARFCDISEFAVGAEAGSGWAHEACSSLPPTL